MSSHPDANRPDARGLGFWRRRAAVKSTLAALDQPGLLAGIGRTARELRYAVMARPFGRRWDRFVAFWASLNLLLVIGSLAYIPCRNFLLQRRFTPIPGSGITIPLGILPDITPWLDPLKGIAPQRESKVQRQALRQLDGALAEHGDPRAPGVVAARDAFLASTHALIEDNSFAAVGKAGTLEKIKNRLERRANLDSSNQAVAALLQDERLDQWDQERVFWFGSIDPLVETNYHRSIDENGRPTDVFWQIDLLLFQSVFCFDILLRIVFLRRRLPGLSWRDAALRRWSDLPLLLPFFRWLRVVPVTERLRSSGLANVEPLRAVVSRAVVAFLAVELFEVLAVQLLDAVQTQVRRPDWPSRIRRFAQPGVDLNDTNEVEALLRLWIPLLMVRVLPRLEPQLRKIAAYALQQSLRSTILPTPLRPLAPLLRAGGELSRPISDGMVDVLVEASRQAGQRLRRHDGQGVDLLENLGQQFWEELATALEHGPTLARTQSLICDFLEEVKINTLQTLSPDMVEQLLEEVEGLISRGGEAASTGVAPIP